MSSGKRRPRAAARERGAGYLLVLFAMAALGIGLAKTGEVWQQSSQREREAQLLFVGHQFRLALAAYRDNTPPEQPIAPSSLAELLEDRRQPNTRHHLRRLWVDPMTGSTDWGLVRVGGRIVGVHSRDEREPIRSVFSSRDAELAGAATYAQWVFQAAAPATPGDARNPAASPNAARSPP